ncbi:MAG: S41 family peptidase [Clostridia bacterium]|nr:S41 family peptidase [Clostridia bacterium]
MENFEQKPQSTPGLEAQKKQKALWWVCLILCLCCALLFVLWQVSALRLRRMGRYFDIDKLNEMLAVFDELSVYDTPSREALTDLLLSAVAGGFGDRYATYFTHEEYESWLSDLSGDYVGLGIAVLWQEGLGYEILDVFEDSPAQKAGMQIGDILTSVDGQSTVTLGAEATLDAILGETGTTVSVTVLRAGQTLSFSAQRAKVVNRSVVYKKIEQGEDSVGYVRITSFEGSDVEGNTFVQFKEAVDTLSAQGVCAFVFDVRDNGGGTLFSVSQMLAYLLPDGPIAHVDYGSERVPDYTVSAEGDKLKFSGQTYTLPEGAHEVAVPMAVLINENSASASELFASALRDYGARGQATTSLVGQTSFGKGTVQTTYELRDGGGYKLTVAKFNPPYGENHDGKGLVPDVAIALSEAAQKTNLYKLAYEDDAQLQGAVQHLLSK